jgi:hypothetical protein
VSVPANVTATEAGEVVNTCPAVGVEIVTVGATLSTTPTVNGRVAVCRLPALSAALTVSV